MNEFHSMLRRQARRAGVDLDAPPDAEGWTNLLQRISRTYESNDKDRYLLERSLEVSSQEMQDLSSQIRSEKEILVAVLGALSTGILHLDRHGRIRFLNPAGNRLVHGYGDGFEGQLLEDVLELTYPDGEPVTRDEIEPVLAAGQPWWDDDCILVRKDGTRCPASVVFNPMRHADELVGVVLTLTDITERKRAQRAIQEARVEAATAERARQAQAAFLANMSHELRTPLNAIIGYSELVVEDADDLGYDEVVPDLEKIRSAGRHLLSIINDVLDMSKIQAGRMDLDVEPTSVDALLTEVVHSVEALIRRNGNALELEVADDLPEVETDPTRLRQALINLVANAAKFTENGSIVLAAERVGGDRLAISVTDTGIGIDADEVERLFEAFTQADASTTRRYGGTGLGLAITKNICDALHADVVVDSEPGVGSTFRIALPLTWTRRETTTELSEASEIALGEPSSVVLTQPVEAAGQNLLLIDDDRATHELVRRYLDGHDLTVHSAFTGREGVAMARTLRPDIIVLDVVLPDADGWDVLSRLKSDPDTADVPLLVVSILADRTTAFELGAEDYLVKPIDRDRLHAILDRYAPDGGDSTVLVVEDDDALREMLGRKIAREGWQVRSAADGHDAIRMLERGFRPDLILLDLMMPALDGFQFLQITRSRSDWAQPPVVVVTAMELTNAQRAGLQRHVETIVEKRDFTTDDMLAAIGRIVDDTLARTAKEKSP